MARAFELAVPGKLLVRLTATFQRPIPMDGFRIETRISRDGRAIATASAELYDRDDRVCASATSVHAVVRDVGLVPTVSIESPQFDSAIPGEFNKAGGRHDLPTFAAAVEVAYPPGETPDPGPTTLWMRVPALLENETATPFQRLCPLADCGNGISRNAELAEFSFVNADITIACFRLPESDWLASRAVSYWESNGIGLASSLLFDTKGPIAEVLQTLLVDRAG